MYDEWEEYDFGVQGEYGVNVEAEYRDIERIIAGFKSVIAGFNLLNERMTQDTRSSSANFGGIHYLVAKSIIAAIENHARFLMQLRAKGNQVVSMDDLEKEQLQRLLVMVTKFEKEMMTPGERLAAKVRAFGEELKKWHL